MPPPRFTPGALRRRVPQACAASALLLLAWACQDATGPAVSPDNEMHVWSGNFSSPDYWLPWTIAHEATHAVAAELWLPTHQQVHDYGDACLKFTMRH